MLAGGKIYHPNQPKNNDVPYSWSPDLPYFNFTDEACSSFHESNKVGCGGCVEDVSDEHFYDFLLANHTVHALRFAKADPKKRPFFIAAGFRRPHTPWHIAQRFVDLYPKDVDQVAPPKYPKWAQGQQPCAFICGGDGVGCDFNVTSPRNASWSSLCRRTYYAAISATDHYIGMVLDELESLGYTDSTAVVLYGDHGRCRCRWRCRC